MKTIFLTLATFIMTTQIMSQNMQVKGNVLSISDKQSAVSSISKLLYDNYIFPEVSQEMENYIKLKLANNEYGNVSDPIKFADELTKDLQFVSKDKHIRVQYNPEQIKRMKEEGLTDDESITPENLQQMKNDNYAFKKVETISGNIGYIDFRGFGPGEVIKDKVASAMGFVQDCDALIFDMRYNGGGDPSGVQLITSYLFGEEPVHLNDLYYRPKDTTEEYWTLKEIKGTRMPDVPVYILTSSYTFSGAEEFSYNLKNLKRATIVGETTGGGAHPGSMKIADNNFIIFVPVGRAINPITKTNWEGTGVKPDVEINSIDALTKAHILALENLKEKEKDERAVNTYSWLIQSLSATLSDMNINSEQLKTYAGNYGERIVYFDNGKLFYQRNGRQKFELTPMNENTFMLNDLEFFRIKFEKDASGKVTGLTGLYDDGHSDVSLKSEN